MNFKNWLILESIDIELAPDIKSFPMIVGQGIETVEEGGPEEIREMMKKSLKYYFGDSFNQASARYKFYLKELRQSFSEITAEFHVVPKGDGTPEMSSEDDPMYDYYKDHQGGKTGYNLHKTPQDALKEIPKDPQLGYRGMSWEEWQYIQKTGHIMSNAGYNIGDAQKNLTFYGDAETAEYYANGFAPIQFMTSKKRPSVVIAVSKNNLMTAEDRPNAIPGGEMAHEGPLNSNEIVGAWMLVPVKSRRGRLDLYFRWAPIKDEEGNYTGQFTFSEPREGSRSSPSISYAIRQLA